MLLKFCRLRVVIRHHCGWLIVAACCLLSGHGAYAVDHIKSSGVLPDGVFPRTVKDLTGVVHIDKQPLRVVVLSTGQTDALLTLGMVPVGATRDGSGLHYPQYLRSAFTQLSPQFAKTRDLGLRSAPDIEVLAALRPDLILANRSTIRSGALTQYRRIAPTVITNGTGINWRKDFLLLSDALGKRQAAEQWMQTFISDARVYAQQFQRAYTDIPEVSFLLVGGGRIRVMGVPSFVGDVAQEMGLHRPAGQRFKRTSQDISIERLDLADGDWAFYGALGTAVDTFTDSPLWPHLKVVQAGHAVQVDYDAFYMNAGPTAARLVMNTVGQHLLRQVREPVKSTPDVPGVLR
jgi:iron complex transport system substrate-binding protein